jgi:uncharacterized RDD family membrane protein YckC
MSGHVERNVEIRHARYAGFWRRLGAVLIDTLVMLPVIVMPFAARSWPTILAVLAVMLSAAATPAYNIYCHGRFGQTVGKRVFRIRVYLVTGNQITWHAAWMRSSPDIVMAALWAVGVAYVLIGRDPASLVGLSFLEWGRTIEAAEPAFKRWTDVGVAIWTWSEPIVMLLNRQRRAIHDFIAGTVVLVVGRGAPSNFEYAADEGP